MEEQQQSDYMTLQASDIYYRPPTIDDLELVHALEAASYPADEAATWEKLKLRIEACPNLFLLAISASSDNIVGFVCGTATSAPKVRDTRLKAHAAAQPPGKGPPRSLAGLHSSLPGS